MRFMLRCLGVLMIGLAVAPFSYAQDVSEDVSAFDARISVYSDATVQIIERIVYQFGDRERRGIFRTIPYSYQAGDETYTADVTNVVVTDDDGVPYQFNESRTGGELTLKIGDPDVTVTGEHVYIISYTVEAPFLYYDNYEEFYWNVTGGSWQTGIERASVLVDLPLGAQVLMAACYQGRLGSGLECDESEQLVNVERAGYLAVANNLQPGEGFTIAVRFPAGTVEKAANPWSPAWYDRYLPFLPFLLPLVVCVALFVRWYYRGRDPKGRGTVVPEYEAPDDVPVWVAGIVYNEVIEPNEISAQIIQLAVDGYLRIHQLEKGGLLGTSQDFMLEKTKTEPPLDPISALLMEKLFADRFLSTDEVHGTTITGVRLSSLKTRFASEADLVVDAMYEEVFARGYFVEQPDKVRARYIIPGIALSFVSFVGVVEGSSTLITMSGYAGILTGILIAIWGKVMPAKTKDGVLLKERLEGLKRYLSVAEADRLAFHNAPDITPERFDVLLPYAVAFGVEKEWAEQFKDVYATEPTWYRGVSGSAFSAPAFASAVSEFSGDFVSASAPASSGAHGGGSVGGGFGGGGGGSW